MLCRVHASAQKGDASTKEGRSAIKNNINQLSADTRAGKYGSYKEAAVALHSNKALRAYAGETGFEFWAVIDQKTFAIKEVSTGFSKRQAKGVYDGSYRRGDGVWHTHPSGGDIHFGDFDSGFRGGASNIYASGDRLTGYDLRAESNPFTTQSEYKNFEGTFNFTKDVYSNGSWSSESQSTNLRKGWF